MSCLKMRISVDAGENRKSKHVNWAVVDEIVP